ncbi:hypothetical protein BV25DRAFT_1921844 [Artomyces pyxidatus]|uniref:Uncharacterized protein n=1 Tax=Artomyces pyxidatus TaxID=48021 RepID=A0ACB8SHZ9_9AGAM|nr:hypothetical protein BV25DRAFT_1921844 [Artomyces pyxidatus]
MLQQQAISQPPPQRFIPPPQQHPMPGQSPSQQQRMPPHMSANGSHAPVKLVNGKPPQHQSSSDRRWCHRRRPAAGCDDWQPDPSAEAGNFRGALELVFQGGTSLQDLLLDAFTSRKVKGSYGGQSPFSVFVKKLQESLTRMESFDVVAVTQGIDDSKRSSSPF